MLEDNEQTTELIERAIQARERSYAPYSKFHVGAALLTGTGSLYTGCNIENAAYTPTNCAERTAFYHAICHGEKHFVKIAVMGGRDTLEYCPPCGVCLQVMMEFCNPDAFQVIMGSSTNDYRIRTLRDLLPEGFTQVLTH